MFEVGFINGKLFHIAKECLSAFVQEHRSEIYFYRRTLTN